MYAKAMVNNGSIVIYYAHEGVMRFPTLIKISKKKNRDKRYNEWDYKNNRVRNTVEHYAQSNEVIDQVLRRANDCIAEYAKRDIKINAKELEAELNSIKSEQQQKHTALLLDWYDSFFERMRKKLVENPNKSKASFKNYTTFKSTILDFEFDKQQQIKVSEIINYDWCVSFTSWMQRDRPESETKNGITYKYQTRGRSSMNTLVKRYEVFKTFCSYLKENKVITDYDIVLRYVREEIKELPSIKTTLTIDEMDKLAGFQLDERLSKVRDLFLIACYTGMRWQDLVNFRKDRITHINGKPVYIVMPQKTRSTSSIKIKIPLAKKVMKLLGKFDYKLDFISNQKANEAIKEALEKTGFFEKLTDKKDKKDNMLKRHEIISFHRGRDTFINNLINTVPLAELMKYTGHTQLSTLQKYLDLKREITPEYINIFDGK